MTTLIVNTTDACKKFSIGLSLCLGVGNDVFFFLKEKSTMCLMYQSFYAK